ncbi:MAG: hypothetical protein ACKO8G_06845 [Actinomycetota bacterium]
MRPPPPPPPPPPTPSPTTGGAVIRWPTPSATLDGVVVRRYDGTGSPASAAGSCAALVVGTSCLDSPAPTGTYSYGLRAVRSAWTASEGPRGATVVVAPPDTTPPTVAAVAIAPDGGTVSGSLRAGGTYRVYARATDDATGIAGVTADLSALTAGATASPLSSAGGPWTIDGSTFGWRSSALVASSSLQHGATPAFEVVATDGAGNVGRRSGTVAVDLLAPIASDWQTTNGGTLGRADAGDTAVFTFNEPLQPSSLVAGWSGIGSLSVVVRITDGGTGNDVLTVWNASNAVQLPLGSVSLERSDYVSASVAFGATGTASTMTLAGGTVTVTLGTPGSADAVAGSNGGWAIWTPSAAATDRAGNACSTTARTEGGSRDREF